MISMADGTTRAIDAIQPGDRLMAYDESKSTTVAAEAITAHRPHVVDHYFVLNGKIRVTGTQPVLSAGRWVEVSQLKIGDTLTAPDGSPIALFRIERIDRKVSVYNLQVTEGTYVADGIVAHNKSLCTVDPCYPLGC
jgi:mannose-6-phosphate isomerase-like protein (cupin superfamily)